MKIAVVSMMLLFAASASGQTLKSIDTAPPARKPFALKSYERVQSVKGDLLLTTRYYSKPPMYVFVVYRINGDTLKQLGSYKSATETSASFAGNENIIVDDFALGFGYYMNIHNMKLDSLKQYRPWDGGYSEMDVQSTPTRLVGVFKSNPGNKWKVASFDMRTGKVLEENSFECNLEFFNKMAVFENQFVLYGFKTIQGYEMFGKRLWTKEGMLSPQVDMYSDNRWLYFFTSTDINIIDPATGQIKSKESLNQVAKEPVDKQGRRSAIRLVKYVEDNDGPGFVLGLSGVGSLMPKDIKSNLRYVKFDASGSKVVDVKIPGETKAINVTHSPGGFQIVTDDKVYNYEY